MIGRPLHGRRSAVVSNCEMDILDAIETGEERICRALLDDQPRFRCRQCGFSGQTWHWQCPSCREWETTRPVIGVLGE